MLPLPDRFDLNVWFTLVSAVLAMGVVLILPKRFSPVEITAYVVFTIFLSQTVDALIAVPPYDLYDVNDSPKLELLDMVMYYLCYPPTAYVYLYFYDRWKPSGWKRALFVLGYALLSVLLELAADLCHVFNYKGWNIYASFFVYVGVYTLYIFVYRGARSLLRRLDRSSVR